MELQRHHGNQSPAQSAAETPAQGSTTVPGVAGVAFFGEGASTASWSGLPPQAPQGPEVVGREKSLPSHGTQTQPPPECARFPELENTGP